MEVAVRELKNHLSDYLKKAEAGEEILVTTHGKPIARISQFEAKEGAHDALGSLSWLRPAKKKVRLGLCDDEIIQPQGFAKSISELMLEDRE